MTIYELNGNTYISDGTLTMQVKATVEYVENNIKEFETKIENLKGAI